MSHIIYNGKKRPLSIDHRQIEKLAWWVGWSILLAKIILQFGSSLIIILSFFLTCPSARWEEIFKSRSESGAAYLSAQVNGDWEESAEIEVKIRAKSRGKYQPTKKISDWWLSIKRIFTVTWYGFSPCFAYMNFRSGWSVDCCLLCLVPSPSSNLKKPIAIFLHSITFFSVFIFLFAWCTEENHRLSFENMLKINKRNNETISEFLLRFYKCFEFRVKGFGFCSFEKGISWEFNKIKVDHKLQL